MPRLLLDGAGSSALMVLAEGTSLRDWVEIAPDFDTDRVGMLLDGLERLLAAQQVEIAELSEIVVITTPGRFTGIRLARALAYGLSFGTTSRVWELRRERAYQSLMSTPRGVLLCDSGKAVAEGGFWRDGVVAEIAPISDSVAVAGLRECVESDISVLALLPQETFAAHYTILNGAGLPVIFPDSLSRAQTLSELPAKAFASQAVR